MRGQLSIELFLVLALMLVFVGLLLTNAEEHLKGIRTLDNAALAKGTLDKASTSLNIVALQGNGSLVRQEFFVPKAVLCFFYDSNETRLFCDSPGFEGKRVLGPKLIGNPFVNQNCFVQGWVNATIKNNGTLHLECSQLS